MLGVRECMNEPLTFTPLHCELALEHPDIDEVREFTSLIVRIRDSNDVGVNVEFGQFYLYQRAHETFALDLLNALYEYAGAPLHWLYEAANSEFLQRFRDRNPHFNPDWARHFIIVVDSDVVEIIAGDAPTISTRSDNIRGWIRPGELRSDR